VVGDNRDPPERLRKFISEASDVWLESPAPKDLRRRFEQGCEVTALDVETDNGRAFRLSERAQALESSANTASSVI
jgi:hypothetical protein